MASHSLTKIAEGREAEIFAWEDGTVLRLMRSPGAQEAVERQAIAMKAAREAGVDVPEVHGTETVGGRPGLIMERIDGPDMLTLIGKQPWTVFSVGTVSGRVHAQLHDVIAPEGIPNLKAAYRSRIQSSDLVPKEIAAFAVAKLEELPDGDRLCHGDFHPGNIIKTDADPVVIDWTNVTRGDPAADFARTDLMLRLGEPPPGTSLQLRAMSLVGRRLLWALYRRAYRRHRPIDDALVERWMAPVMANRLVENIEEERPKLLKLLEKRLEERH